ncbi:hypothetical protein C8R44DRAFT_730488 [Mycena epipterygia]|nr:hypothetical protein C8R44DRAFT_730488 [Mycena epipterygia]
MPKLKRKACVGNLGSFAKKKVKLAESQSPSPEVSRSATPERSVASLDEFNAPTFDQDSIVSSANSDLSEDLNDVPVFETENTLLSWLEVGKKRLKEIMDAVKHPDVKEKSRGQYYNDKTRWHSSSAHGTIATSQREENCCRPQGRIDVLAQEVCAGRTGRQRGGNVADCCQCR